MNPVVVYKSSPASVTSVVRLLRKHRLQPTVLDNPDSTMQHAARGSYRVRIAVPAEEASKARQVLMEMETASEPVLDDISRTIRKQVLMAVLISAAAACIFRCFYASWSEIPWGAVGFIGVASLVVIGNIPRLCTWWRNRSPDE